MASSITDYTAIVDRNIDRLVNAVNRKISEGWQPQGGISCMVHSNSNEESYAQALVRIEEDEDR